MQKFDLSIIIPTLNEEVALPLLLADLSAQEGISIEVIVSDGSSSDNTVEFANGFFTKGHLVGQCLVGVSGRGRQLNAGARVARSEQLLFLHADSRILDSRQLLNALTHLRYKQEEAASDAFAGRFSLCFDSTDESKGFGLYYYEYKARLGRGGCIHGDQGLLLSKSFFSRIGPFREDLPVMEDTSIAEAIRGEGQWLLLPGEIMTSARRFQVEGIKARQTLNALMMNFLSIGWLDFFVKAPDIYRQQDRTKDLQLRPFFRLIRELLKELPLRRRLSIWMATGAYVRGQAWQIGLLLDCKKAYRKGLVPAAHNGACLRWFDRWFEPMTNNFFGRIATALMVRIWFSFQI